ncbi:MAG: AMP-binding protein, partial [Candidatus Bathyarchaeota archaeon]|nr:AMP-binding protein [Candidatus Bathyarchaeota archaeon]
MASEIVWRPTGAYLKKSNIRRFMDKHDIDDYDGLVRRSIEERDWFWNAVVEDANVEWFEPYTRVYDDSRGIEWARWFVDGKINIVHNVLDRHALSSRRDKLAFIWASETGEERMVTYGELYEDVNRFANGLRSLGIGRGDPVCMYMPMVPEIIVAFLAILKIGAIAVPIFSAFGPEAVRTRLEDVDARIVLTADGSIRHGRTIEIKAKADQCVEGVGTVEKIIVLKRLGNDIPWKEGRDVWWDELVSGQPEECRTEEMDSEDTAML